MSSKWASDDEGKDGDGNGSPLTPNSPPNEQKDVVGGKRSRRPRPGRSDTVDLSKDGVERQPVKTVTGGWGLDDAGSTATSEAQRKSSLQMMEMQEKPIEGNRRKHFDNDETEILIIPDLEDEGEEDIVLKVAAAPKNTTRRVPSLRELDEDLKHSVPSSTDGLDMSLLTKTLVPPELLEEDDSPWDFDSLLQSVTQESNAEKRLAINAGLPETEPDTGLWNHDSRPQEGSSAALQMQSGSHRPTRALVA